MTDKSESQIISIGAAAREVGVTPHVLRKWQSRYGIVSPLRGRNGRRTYSREQITQLQQIKRLLDAGIGLKDLASRTKDEIAEMASQLTAPQRFQLGIFGAPFIETAEQAARMSSHFVLQFSDHSWQKLTEVSSEPFDLLILDVPNLDTDNCRDLLALQSSAPKPIFVVYRYVQPAILKALQASNIRAYRGPVSLQMMQDLVISLFPTPTLQPAELAPAEPRKYTDAAVRKAANAASEIECECPGNVANILKDLYAFEQYSLECIVSQPEDKEMHAYLHQTTANARTLFEAALGQLAAHENIDLDNV